MNRLRDMVSRNLRKPESTLFGKVIKKILIKRNSFAELKAVSFCDIKPNDVVLEVGFGPGVGIEAATEFIKKGQGRIYGADFSPEMVKVASDRLQQQIQNGWVTLTEADVQNLPYSDKMFDKVFHVNCYYFWPDIDKACRELHRVMKPGSVMIAAMSPGGMKQIEENGFMKYGNTDYERYMKTLNNVGFTNVKAEEFTEKKMVFRIISAHVTDNNTG